jgi:hypothetical protein
VDQASRVDRPSLSDSRSDKTDNGTGIGLALPQAGEEEMAVLMVGAGTEFGALLGGATLLWVPATVLAVLVVWAVRLRPAASGIKKSSLMVLITYLSWVRDRDDSEPSTIRMPLPPSSANVGG